ncbi:hypothetical protein VTK56DRAFT_4147 [Thermocarpiscus australiensis]
MPFQLRPATGADSFRIGCIGRDAFRETDGRALFPPHLHSKSETGDPWLDEAKWRAARNTRRMREGKPTFVVVDDQEDESRPEKIVGFAQWELPSQSLPAKDGNEAGEEPLPASLDGEALRANFEVMEAEAKKALGPDGHSKMWYLMILAVDPDYQRRGIGKMLLQHGLDLAAQEGRDVFLIATAEGRNLYQSLGFRQIGEPYNVYDRPHYSMLWQRPDSAAP